nr:MAG TPA: hypothetical protein [Caudoviricetes sp.]
MAWSLSGQINKFEAHERRAEGEYTYGNRYQISKQ